MVRVDEVHHYIVSDDNYQVLSKHFKLQNTRPAPEFCLCRPCQRCGQGQALGWSGGEEDQESDGAEPGNDGRRARKHGDEQAEGARGQAGDEQEPESAAESSFRGGEGGGGGGGNL